MVLKIGGKVEKLNGKELSYADFVEKYMARNQPVVLTGLTDDWRACRDWVSDDAKPNLCFFSNHFGSSRVQVADCCTREFTDQKREEMSVSEFIGRWLEKNHADNCSAHGKTLMYLKDWHFAKEYPEYFAYTTPMFFLDDWLNLYLDKFQIHEDSGTSQQRDEISCSDYRFVYMGAKGTWTPLHADVFRSYSWSANVCGKKQWYFLSPSQHHLVFDRCMKYTVYDIFEDVCNSKFPGFKDAVWLECTQEQNEIIFVPSGWYHQVHNVEDTISINHNWFNGYNISWVWDLLLREYHEAREYIEDIKDICENFEELCQRNLAANAGMDFKDFFTFMIRIATANLVLLYQIQSCQINIHHSPSQIARLLISNLKSIRNVALKMESVDAWEDRCITIDLREIIEDNSFSEFCGSLASTYGMIYKQSELNCYPSNFLLGSKELNISNLFDSRISSPEELVTFTDHALLLIDDIVGIER